MTELTDEELHYANVHVNNFLDGSMAGSPDWHALAKAYRESQIELALLRKRAGLASPVQHICGNEFGAQHCLKPNGHSGLHGNSGANWS